MSWVTMRLVWRREMECAGDVVYTIVGRRSWAAREAARLIGKLPAYQRGCGVSYSLSIADGILPPADFFRFVPMADFSRRGEVLV